MSCLVFWIVRCEMMLVNRSHVAVKVYPRLPPPKSSYLQADQVTTLPVGGSMNAAAGTIGKSIVAPQVPWAVFCVFALAEYKLSSAILANWLFPLASVKARSLT